jgi:excisionase family DNA binding protein
MGEKLISAQELATYLGIKEITIYKHVQAGLIPALRVGKLLRFDLEKVKKALEGDGEQIQNLKSKIQT